MEEHENIKQLLERYLSGDCTPEERIRVEQWYRNLDIKEHGLSEKQVEGDIDDIRDRLPTPPVRRTADWYRYAAAIAAFLVLAIAVYFQFNRSEPASVVNARVEMSDPNDIAPGSNKAILKLANGKEVVLDGRPAGKIAQEGSQLIYKDAGGDLVYRRDTHDENNAGTPIANTIQTPRGGQYHLMLPDGTKVWLNAASSLTYAVNASTKERLVKLEGEAYFEVAKDPKRPFRVESGGQLVEVLGTNFNINCYADEGVVKTTLVEGAVKVGRTTKHRSVILQPGQQAMLDQYNHLSVKQVDVSDALAWKNGKFSFNHADIGTVMRQLSRWYDVEVVFKGKIPNVKLSGEVYRNTNASNVLKILSFYNLNCRIETIKGVKQIVIQ